MDLTALDLVEINNLAANYALAVDARDLALLETLWTDDAVFRLVRDAVGLGAPLRGRDCIVQGFRAFFARAPAPSAGSFTRHLWTSPRLTIAADEVRATTALVSVRQELIGEAIRIHPSKTGLYQDRIVRDSGRWRFAERELAWDPPERHGVALPDAVYGPLAAPW